MRLTLLNTGLEVEVPMAGEKRGKDRMIESFERRNAGRLPGDLTPLSASASGAQASTAAGRNDNSERVDKAPTLAADALAEAAFAVAEGDIVGDEVRAKLRRLVSRQLNERWIEDEKRGLHNHGAAELQQFRKAIDSGVEAAVKAYARLKLTLPTDLRAEIAASRANVVNEV
jgi:hypothetical protein